MSDYKYRFSVIMPVYKVEKYVAESIDSVINQTVGFKENIELILVNDASPDNSGEICEKYAQKYPENIKYVVQESLGVSAARNNGLSRAQGKYINFLDSDDKWEPDAFELAESFFDKYDVNILACRMEYFDAREGFNHPLDYKFDGDRIIDITKDYNDIQMQGCTSVFYRHECLEGRQFDTTLPRSQDTAFLMRILMDEGRYGISRDIVHQYRKRSDNSSAVDTRFMMPVFYTTILKNAWEILFDLSKEKYGEILPFFQYTVMYELQWRIKNLIQNVISEEEKAEYINRVRSLLSEIDDEIIMEQRNINPAYKLFALNLKYGKYAEPEKVIDFSKRSNIRVESFSEDEEGFKIRCSCKLSILGDRYSVGIIDEKKNLYRGSVFYREDEQQIAFDGTVVDPKQNYEFCLPREGEKEYEIVILRDGEKMAGHLPAVDPDSGLVIKEKGSYLVLDRLIVEYKRGRIVVSSNSLANRNRRKIAYGIRRMQNRKN